MSRVACKAYQSHGDGSYSKADFRSIGSNVVLESGVLVFHPSNISIGSNVYIGHNTILKGYYKNQMRIGDNSWIGQGCFFHSAGGIYIGESVGVGPMVKIITSSHSEDGPSQWVLMNELMFAPVRIEDGCDIGIGSIILPGVTVGEGSIVGAGSVVTKDIPTYCVAAGVPAKPLRHRDESRKV